MDDALRALQRAAESDPADPAAARRFEQALRRAGDGERLRERYRLKFACPLRFEDLAETESPDLRSCASCQRTVRLLRRRDELGPAVSEGQCVAFPRSWQEGAITTVVEAPELDSAEDPATPCFVTSQVGWVDLAEGATARRSVEPGLARLFLSEDLHAWPALPLRVEAGVLHLAVGRLEPPPGVLDQLRLMSGLREFQVWLAEPRLVYDLLAEHAAPPALLMGMVLPEDHRPALPDDEGPRLA